MNMKFKNLLLILCIAASPFMMEAQIMTPQPSPSAKLEQKVGLGTVTVEYSRPSVRDREIYGNLVPYGKYWRTGANAATKVTFSEDVKIGGKEVKAGTYSMFTMPNTPNWEVIFHSNTSYYGSGDTYEKDGEVARVSATPKMTNSNVETFRIDINDIKSGGANIVIEWGNQQLAVPFTVNTDEKVIKSIESVMAGPSARDYYMAASYYNAEGKDPKQALEWMNKAVDGGMNQFWVLRQKSLIQANAGDYKGAIETANASLKAAEAANNGDYVKMNKDSIAEWSKKK